jgi:hypothetical protein
MKYMLALLVFVLGLEGVDRALLERAMESMKPPRRPDALHMLLHPPRVPPPPPPPKIRQPDWLDY